MIETQKPVVIANVAMPQMSGLELARSIKDKNLNVTLVFLTIHKNETLFNTAMDSVVRGKVLKENLLEARRILQE